MDLCIGCGVCAGVCPKDNLVIKWDSNGLYVPEVQNKCPEKCRLCLEICPFYQQNRNEDAIASKLFGSSLKQSPNVGYYLSCHVGYASNGYRERGASGGMASWFMASLLKQEIVDYVICVRARADSHCLFEYAIVAASADLLSTGKSAYYPVELSKIIRDVIRNPGRYALIGVPCFIKAVRLAMERIPMLRNRLVLLAGLVCGQTKSRMFTDFLVHKVGLEPRLISEVIYRGKRADQPANLFEIQVRDVRGVNKTMPWDGLYSQTWTSGMFSPRSCSFCDDTFAELADISFMDAWLPGHISQSGGSSLLVCRTAMVEDILNHGIANQSIQLDRVDVAAVEASQAPVSAWKRQELSWRLWLAQKYKFPAIKKRVPLLRPPWWQAGRLMLRERLRQYSLRRWGALSKSGSAGMEAAARAIERRLFAYRLFLSSPALVRRARRFPSWIFKRVKGRLRNLRGQENNIPRFLKIGVGCQIHGGYFGTPNRIQIGDFVFIGPEAYIAGRGGIKIGSGTIIAMRVIIRSSNHRYDGPDLRSLPFDDVAILRRVDIGENVWIGDHVTICPGVSIGEGSVVAMGSVVSQDVPPLSVVAGNPARVVKVRDKQRYETLKADGKFYWRERQLGRLDEDCEIRIGEAMP